MDNMKKFKTFFLIFVGAFLAVQILTYAMMRRPYKKLDYEITFSVPEIVIEEAEGNEVRGNIKGKITNNTGAMIPLKYLKFEFYNEKGTYLKTEFKELKNFHPDEVMKIDLSYTYNEISFVKISLQDDLTERERAEIEQMVEKAEEIANKVAPFIKVFTIIFLVLP